MIAMASVAGCGAFAPGIAPQRPGAAASGNLARRTGAPALCGGRAGTPRSLPRAVARAQGSRVAASCQQTGGDRDER